MCAATDAVQDIQGQKLTTWTVLHGGERICLGFASAAGGTHRIILPFEALTGLLMTLPRMLQSALNERFPDGTLRVVHPLGTWRIEQAEGDNGVILKLSTPDGFEVAFAVPGEDADPLGAALLARDVEPNPIPRRRPN
jgi:hypothetical protein